MDHGGHWFHFLGAQQYENITTLSSLVLLAISDDLGHSWSSQSVLDTTNSYGANTATNFQIKGGASGKFVAVWQAELPSGQPTIWFSTNQTFALTSANNDWLLVE